MSQVCTRVSGVVLCRKIVHMRTSHDVLCSVPSPCKAAAHFCSERCGHPLEEFSPLLLLEPHWASRQSCQHSPALLKKPPHRKIDLRSLKGVPPSHYKSHIDDNTDLCLCSIPGRKAAFRKTLGPGFPPQKLIVALWVLHKWILKCWWIRVGKELQGEETREWFLAMRTQRITRCHW